MSFNKLGAILGLLAALAFWPATASAQATSVRLAWDASADAAVTGYMLYYGRVSSTTTNSLDARLTTTATVTNLQSGVPYFFYVTAYNVSRVESDPSNLITHTLQNGTPLGVQMTGLGTLSPNYSNAVLEVGRDFSMTATPASGYAFVNWTTGAGVAITNSPSITFRMQSNLVLRANFVDSGKPVVTITSPANGTRLSNAVVNVTGTATDNLAVTKVQRQLNGGAWENVSGLSSWSASLPLAAGTNVVQVYAEDAAGNRSATNSVSYVYVPSSVLVVQTSGSGTISPNYNNASLEVGTLYTMTASPASGFAFTNWTTGAEVFITNSPALSFRMQSNLVLRANFVDVAKPVVTISSPANGARLSNAVVTATGTATDNLAVTKVQRQLNGGAWENVTGLTSWSAGLAPSAGTNVLQVYAEDAAGNRSTTNNVTFVYALGAPLVVQTNGNGTISPNYNNTLLEVGTFYAMTATPAAGFAFTNWTTGEGSYLTNSPALSFRMQSNLVLRANFVDVAKPVVVITSPAGGTQFSNAAVSVTGTSSDNLAVTKVQRQLNGGGWENVSGLASWSAALTLAQGTNALQVYAEDAAGNRSVTNSISLVYVPSSVLVVQTSGSGTISPNYNNAALAVGTLYAMTATPASGYAFTNWTTEEGSYLTNSPTLSFRMQSNLVLRANFVDVAKPVVAIANPANGAQFSNAVVSVTGTSSDNLAVTKVQRQLNGGGWENVSGLASWSAALTLAQGTNVLQVYAEDAAGNRSVTNSISLVYVPSSVLVVQTSGSGAISPNYNNAALEVGTLYTMTATPASGYAFTNWTTGEDAYLTNSPTLSFRMQSNLVLRANFVDVAKPVIIITSPANGARFSNAVISVTGTSSDNLAVVKVQHQLNGGVWENVSGLASWSAALTLAQGTNVLQVYAEDAAGNCSVTNSLSLVYSLGAPLVVQTNGNGTVSPNYNNALLEIGSLYGMTATAGTGFTFTNWTDDAGNFITNSPSLSFRMQSNLVLRANFVDVFKPLVTIATPANGARLSNSVVNVSGTASDNLAVVKVQRQLNGGGWQEVSGLTSWSAPLAPATGTNVLQVYAEDAAGNRSTTNTVTFTYLLSAPLVVQTNGNGAISPNYNNAWLEIGNLYAMNATPASGSVFTNWTDGAGTFVTNTPAISFRMQSNLVLRANFVDVTKPTLTISSPANNARLSNSVVIVTGTASDNIGLLTVQRQLNGGGWQPANGLSSWTAAASPVLGTNVFQVYAEDAAGNRSTTNTLTFVYVASSTLQVEVVGNGSFSPNYNGAALEVGKTYAMNAISGEGYGFNGWTDPEGNVVTNHASLKFTMQLGLVLTANFGAKIPLEIQTTGKGTLLPNYSNSVMQVGKAYKMTATAGTGFVFTNWTDGNGLELTNGPALGFLMQSNLVLRANFVDVRGPTVTVTNFTDYQKLSNAVVTVGGRVTDNLDVASVHYALNDGAWSPTTGLTNWSAVVYPIAGTNFFRIYAEDSAGNRSDIEEVPFVFVVNLPLDLQTTGKGTLSPNYSNEWLQIGKPYKMTATAGSGFAFTNWTDAFGVPLTNSTALNFVMQTNLALRANFVDIRPPDVTITNLVENQKLSNAVFTVAGRVTENGELAVVRYELNGGGWKVATGLTNWSADLSLIAGTNVLRVFAEDTAGNSSAIEEVAFVYVVNWLLDLQNTGRGTLSPNYSNSVLQIGKAYKMTATAGSGYVFTNWTDADGFELTNGPSLSFLMQSNLALRANFVDIVSPTLTVNNLTEGQRVSNTVMSVVGKVTDNGPLARVSFQVNNGAWQLAEGTTNWTSLFTLTSVSNVFRAYAMDAAGNKSPTNAVTFIYAGAADLVGTNGVPQLPRIANDNGNLSVSNGFFQMRITATNGATVIIESTTNFTQWTPIQTNVVTGGAVTATVPLIPLGREFFRALIR